jgi:circadian clock protein KaiC
MNSIQKKHYSQESMAAGRLSTGIIGLDQVLEGGLTPQRLYLIEGNPGAGKTTLALQFLLEGIRQGESCLYITLSETAHELHAVADSHGWDISQISIFEMVGEEGLDPDSEQSILHPSEIELGETTRAVMQRIDETKPQRIIFDSLSEMRLLAQNALRYRRQILALKYFFAARACTVFLLDDRTSEAGDLHLHSVAHGVISLDQAVQEFGSERRKLRIIKMRGLKYQGGYHDFNLRRGGIDVFPRLIASSHHSTFNHAIRTTGNERLDEMLGGGLVPGTNTLLSGPSGVGKTTTAIQCALAALERGEKVVYYLFDEGIGTLLLRAKALNLSLDRFIDNGHLTIQQIDPAELSPGEFTNRVCTAVERDGAKYVVIDSLNAYVQAMPGEKFLLLQMHELLAYLNQQGVTTILILGQHGLLGEVRTNIDLSYLSDAIVSFHFFGAESEIRTALAVVKSRTAEHQRSVREFKLGQNGVQVGKPLEEFDGLIPGLPHYRGGSAMFQPGLESHA